MQFLIPLVEGRLLRRYSRFLADVQLLDDSLVTAHTANTGSMLGCAQPGSRVWLSQASNVKRKYPFTWEMVETLEGSMVGINTALSNRLVEEAILNGTLRELQDYDGLRREVSYGLENSRIDLLLEGHQHQPDCYVEVKNVTALTEDSVAIFPDAVSQRGSKHLRELRIIVEQGKRGVVVFCIQRADAKQFQPAEKIDPTYAKTLCSVVKQGVELLAYQTQIDTTGIQLTHRLPIIL